MTNQNPILKHLLTCVVLIFIMGCYLPNDPPYDPKFSFGFHGRLELLEDAFYSLNLSYKERNFSQYLQSSPEYEFVIVRSDTTINYVARLVDCQNFYSLVNSIDTSSCDSSYILIDEVSSNIDSLPNSVAKSIFKNEIIDHLVLKINSVTITYHWTIEKKQDTLFVKILNQNDSLRKLHIFSLDSISNVLVEKKIINYLGDSTVIYMMSPEQRYVYIKSKRVIRR